MDVAEIKRKIQEQNKLVQAEIGGVQKGYEQALMWVSMLLESDTRTTNSGTTETVNVDGKANPV